MAENRPRQAASFGLFLGSRNFRSFRNPVLASRPHGLVDGTQRRRPGRACQAAEEKTDERCIERQSKQAITNRSACK
jgi:hypothetical protein